MAKILVLGAGRSTASLIDYLLRNSTVCNWEITIADSDLHLAVEKASGHEKAVCLALNASDAEKRRAAISEHDLVISMLPAFMHAAVARDCVDLGKHMATASYVSDDMRALDAEAKKKNLLLLNECGLDPGIDHASAMKIIDGVKGEGGEVSVFKSYCGGLVAPESNDNPWGYKFSWNPRNVVLAGQGTAQHLHEGELKFIPYNRLFTQTETVQVDNYGSFDAYANRDSISYIGIYGLNNIKTMLRGTLRQSGFCRAWHVFVKLGLTDDSLKIHNANRLSYKDFIKAFLPQGAGTVQERLKRFMGNEYDRETERLLDYLEIFSDRKIEMEEGSAAQILQRLLEEKWRLKEGDKDMIVMQHQFEYTTRSENKAKKINSSLVVIGKDEHHTAMARTVGLPLAITVKNFLTGKFAFGGVQIPTRKEIYAPLLSELESFGIRFAEEYK